MASPPGGGIGHKSVSIGFYNFLFFIDKTKIDMLNK
jgi:hypothetical protein